MIAVTTSDDKSWKMWTIPEGQMIMRGDGHTDWLSGCDFHPEYLKFNICMFLFKCLIKNKILKRKNVSHK